MALDHSPEYLRGLSPFLLSLSENNLQEFLCVRIVQVAPFTDTMFIDRLKFREQFFEKGHPRNIFMKLFPHLTSGFREDNFF